MAPASGDAAKRRPFEFQGTAEGAEGEAAIPRSFVFSAVA